MNQVTDVIRSALPLAVLPLLGCLSVSCNDSHFTGSLGKGRDSGGLPIPAIDVNPKGQPNTSEEPSDQPTTIPTSSSDSADSNDAQSPSMESESQADAGNPCDPGNPGGLIDFETLPDGRPSVDNMVISDEYFATHGVKFSFTNGQHPRIAKVGSPKTAHNCSSCAIRDDGIQPGENLGSSFLTDYDGEVAGAPPPLIITYARPVAKASAVIIDIDARETWTVEALGQNGNVLSRKVLTGDGPISYNGRGQLWSVDLGADPAIYSLRFSGKKDGDGFGLGFDHFSPSSICPAK